MKEETVLSLKWQSFPSHLAVSLDTCYEKQQFVDLSLVCKDGTILKCHKMVLANSSTFFRRLLVANEHPHPMIILHDIEADDLKTIVNFMYCGEIQVVQSEVRRLLKLAEILEVTGLRHIQTSILGGDSNSTVTDTLKKSTTVSRLKIEETKNLSNKSGSEYESFSRLQTKLPTATRFVPAPQPHKNIAKPPQDTTRHKSEEFSVNTFSQRLETGSSGISIIDINDIPSTSRGLQQNVASQKRKESSDSMITWPRILSAISKNKPLPLKKLCIMDEVEITVGKPITPVADNKQQVPLDRRKTTKDTDTDSGMKYAVYIKDEIDISSDKEEDIDPLEVDEVDNENADATFHYSRHSGRYTHRDFSSRKGLNG